MTNLPRLLPRGPDARVRSRRIDLSGGVTVESRTIGTPMSYVLATSNLSRTGLLTQVHRNLKVPYRVNTLVELTIDPAGALFDHPVECLAKVVRIVRPKETDGPLSTTAIGRDDDGCAYGMHIVQMDPNDQAAWEACIAELEAEQPPEPEFIAAADGA
jgi:hypothetical protein